MLPLQPCRFLATALCLAAALSDPEPLAAQAPRVIECGTNTSRRAHCAAGGEIVSAKLVQELSSRRCGPDGTWGWTDSTVWTDNGCRGRFEVSFRAAADSTTRHITCGSVTTRRYECATGGKVDSVRLVKRSLFARCTQGTNWGHTDTLIWAGNGCRAEFAAYYQRARPTPRPAPAKPLTRTISCGKTTGELHTCTTDGAVDTVRLARDLGTTACRQKTNWDYARGFVWAKGGCRGLFEVTYKDTTKAATRMVTCGSGSAIEVQCATGGNASRVRVVRSLGTAECRQGVNWKFTRDEIIAGRGCRAEFEVTLGGAAAPQMGPVTAPPAKVVTCGDARGSAMTCNAFGTVATVRLQRDRSGGKCGQSASWGLGDRAIWVAKGCYADFELTYTVEP